jgi:hypothetical protein
LLGLGNRASGIPSSRKLPHRCVCTHTVAGHGKLAIGPLHLWLLVSVHRGGKESAMHKNQRVVDMALEVLTRQATRSYSLCSLFSARPQYGFESAEVGRCELRSQCFRYSRQFRVGPPALTGTIVRQKLSIAPVVTSRIVADRTPYERA